MCSADLTQATCVLYCYTILNSILRSIIAIRIPLLWLVNVFMRFSATNRLTYHFIGTPHTHHIIAINKIFLVTIVTPGKISDTPLNPSNITLRATVFYFLGSGDLDCYSNLFIWHILEHIAVRLYKWKYRAVAKAVFILWHHCNNVNLKKNFWKSEGWLTIKPPYTGI